MGFFQAVTTCFIKIFSYGGRATRAEFWWFFLFHIIMIPIAILMMPMTEALSLAIYFIIAILVNTSLFVRRLHDIGSSGWLILPYYLGLILGNLILKNASPKLGALILICCFIFFLVVGLTASAPDNKYGKNPHENLKQIEK